MNTNEETRLRNLLSKKGAGIKLNPLDVLYLKKLSAKKATEESLDDTSKLVAESKALVRTARKVLRYGQQSRQPES